MLGLSAYIEWLADTLDKLLELFFCHVAIARFVGLHEQIMSPAGVTVHVPKPLINIEPCEGLLSTKYTVPDFSRVLSPHLFIAFTMRDLVIKIIAVDRKEQLLADLAHEANVIH